MQTGVELHGSEEMMTEIKFWGKLSKVNHTNTDSQSELLQLTHVALVVSFTHSSLHTHVSCSQMVAQIKQNNTVQT